MFECRRRDLDEDIDSLSRFGEIGEALERVLSEFMAFLDAIEKRGAEIQLSLADLGDNLRHMALAMGNLGLRWRS